MSTLRVLEAELAADAQYKIRVHRVAFAAAQPINPKVRVHDMDLVATGAVVISVPAGVTVGPGEAVELVAELLTPGAATWQWRRISGPSIGLAFNGDTATFAAPSIWNADRVQPDSGLPGVAVLAVGVRATIDGVQSPEVRCEVTILPQLSWTRSGDSWIGSRTAPATTD